MDRVRDAILTFAGEYQPCTCRQIYYLGIGRHWDKDTGRSRKHYGTVVRLVGELRESGDLPWGWIADHTRQVRRDQMFTSKEQALRFWAGNYRRDLWAAQPRRVEVWCESDSIAGVLDDVTRPNGVGLYVCRGQSSKTFVYEAVLNLRRVGKPATVLYVGDWDPSGLAIPFSVEDRMARYSDGVELDLRRLAVTPDDVASDRFITHSVNTRDPNYPRFADRCRRMDLAPQTAVEVEALPPDELRQRVTDAIDELTDTQEWLATLVAEQSERDLLERMVSGDASAYRQLVAVAS
jgi:hypothetical protein